MYICIQDFDTAAAKATVVNVMGNKITQVPASIGTLTLLVELNVSENALTELCPEIGFLVALQVCRRLSSNVLLTTTCVV